MTIIGTMSSTSMFITVVLSLYFFYLQSSAILFDRIIGFQAEKVGARIPPFARPHVIPTTDALHASAGRVVVHGDFGINEGSDHRLRIQRSDIAGFLARILRDLHMHEAWLA